MEGRGREGNGEEHRGQGEWEGWEGIECVKEREGRIIQSRRKGEVGKVRGKEKKRGKSKEKKE